jgi:ATP-dependent helicase HrpB
MPDGDPQHAPDDDHPDPAEPDRGPGPERDVAPDPGPDVAPETGPGLGPDLGSDLGPDPGPDVAPDRSPDLGRPDGSGPAPTGHQTAGTSRAGADRSGTGPHVLTGEGEPGSIEGVIPAVRRALLGAAPTGDAPPGPSPGTTSAVLVAPPGSGKTTVVPLRLLDEPWLEGRRILVLEPRRLATRAAARRMAHLLGEDVGGTVGYTTRDERRTSAATRIEVVTEGVLTRRLQHDPELAGVGLVVFDELHERNLQTDLGLALVLDVRRTLRPDLRVLAMSATLDAGRVATLLGGPVIEGGAAPHPVEVRWRPRRDGDRLEPAIADAVRVALRDTDGDVLVFLPGTAEIRRTAELLHDVAPAVDVLPLHGSLPVAEQDRAIVVGPRRRVVLSTDIAESSLTVEGVRVVVDSGVARAPRLDPRTGMTRLTTVTVSRASTEQRAGRAGRLGPGVAYRLWSPMEQATRRPHTDPEITQVDLASLALELAAWGSDDLPWLDRPPARALADGRALLRALGALDGDGRLTDTGRAMSRLPLHPRLAHLVVAAAAQGHGVTACAIAALVDERDVLRGRDTPADLAVRLQLLDGGHHPDADLRAVAFVRERWFDLMRRADIADRGYPSNPGGHGRPGHPVLDPELAGPLLALAYPDRLAVRKGAPGRFQLRTGTSAWVPPTDPLATAGFVIAADLDGKRKDTRIRLGAALSPSEVADAFGDQVEVRRQLTWDRRGELVERVERRLGGIVLDEQSGPPHPGPEVRDALIDRARSEGLPWTSEALTLRRRVAWLRARDASHPHEETTEPGSGWPGWPDWSDDALARSLDEWLGPLLGRATSLGGVDLELALRSQLSWDQHETLDRRAPTHLTLPNGRRHPLDWSEGRPVLAVRVQALYGSAATPEVDGEPVLLHLLSPADRPVQVTSDLAGFWAGSWAHVRVEMAGRYPKHAWPADPVGNPDARR